MAFRSHQRSQLWQLLSRQTLKPQAFCLQMDADPDAGEIQGRRDQCADHQLTVGHAAGFRDQKGSGAHDRRHDLAARGCGSLDRTGKFRLIAQLFHQRDREGTGGNRVGDRGTGDRSLQSGGKDRHLRRSAGRPACQRVRQINEELADAGLLQEGAEQDEQENVGGADAQRVSDDALGGDEQVGDDPLPGESAVLQEAGQILADASVEEEAGRDDDDGRSHHTPAGQQHEGNAHRRHNGIHDGVGACPELQRLEVDDEIACDGDERRRKGNVIPRQFMPVRVLRRRVQNEGQADGEAQMRIPQDLQRNLVGDGGVQLEQCPERQDDLNDPLALRGKLFVFRFPVNGGKIDLLRRNLFLLFKQCHGLVLSFRLSLRSGSFFR